MEHTCLANHLCPFSFEHELDAQTNPEDGFLFPPRKVEFFGFWVIGRFAGAWREHNHFCGHSDCWIDRFAVDHHHLVKTGQQMLEVSGEGVLMINKQDHSNKSS